MKLQFPPLLIIPLSLTLLIVVALLLFIWKRRSTQGAAALFIMIFGLAIWLSAAIVEYLVVDIALKFLWIKVEYIGILIVPLSLLVFAGQYTNRNQWISARNIILLALIPTLTLILIFTSDYHHMFFTDITSVFDGKFVISATTHGWAFWLHAVYSYVLILAATIQFVLFYLHSPRIYRRQVALILIGVMMPWLANVVYIFGWGPSNLDLTPFAHAILGVIIVYSMFYLQFLDIRPVARRTIVDCMKDGILVLDAQNRLADINPAALQIINLNADESNTAIGKAISELIDIPAFILDRISDEAVEVVIKKDESGARIITLAEDSLPANTFELQTQPLLDNRGRVVGQVIALHNIARLKSSQVALRQAHEALEARVVERTSVLEELNRSILDEIAERKLAEIALRESEQKYRQLVMHSPASIFEINVSEQRFENVNEVMCEYTGYTHEEFMALSPFDLLAESSQQRFRDRIQRYQSTGKEPGGSIELQIKKKNGEEIWALINSKWVTTNGVLKIKIVIYEITERKKMEEALQQAHHNLQQRNQLLTQIIELGDALHQNLDLNALLHEIVHSLGFETAVLNLANQETQKVHVWAAAGTDQAAIRELTDATYNLEEFTDVMLPKYQIGRCYFVPAGEFRWWEEFPGPTYIPDTAPPDENSPDAWHPEDFLLIPIRLSDGQLVGFISVDQPIDGKRPTPESLLPLEIFANQVASTLENAKLFQQVQQELEQRLRAEARIKASLKEKEVLLKEIHHRVKNNLQIISSLLNLQSTYSTDTTSTAVFQDSQNRVRSMALIHEKLYQSENLSQINFAEYISDLGRYLVSVYRGTSAGVGFNVDAEEILLAIDTAVPCGLILNELISNALKHAFKGMEAGKITVTLQTEKNRHVKLVIADNGIGLPPDFNRQSGTSLGLMLVDTLIDQLDGTLQLTQNGETGSGSCFAISFPLPEEEPQV